MKKEAFINILAIFVILGFSLSVFYLSSSSDYNEITGYPVKVCGDSVCEAGENSNNCPQDCPASCSPGQTNSCTTSDNCPGQQNCAAGQWGNCADIAGDNCPSTITNIGVGGTSTIEPVRVVFYNLLNEDILRIGKFKLIVLGYEGSSLSSDLNVNAISNLFGEAKLSGNFEGLGPGFYGANIDIPKGIANDKYDIIAVAEAEEAIDQDRVFVNIDSRIRIDPLLQQSYELGKEMMLAGKLSYSDNKSASNASLIVKGYQDKNLMFAKDLPVDNNGMFNATYFLSFAHPLGGWKLVFDAADDVGNSGIIEVPVNITPPKGVSLYYTVHFIRPAGGEYFTRGDTIPIIIEVFEGSSHIDDANVNFISPKEKLTMLAPAGNGTYSGEYKIGLNDKLGKFILPVQAIKSKSGISKAGGSHVEISVLPTQMNLIVLSPTSEKFFSLENIKFEVQLKYMDGSSVKNAFVDLQINNKSINLKEEGDIYKASYMFSNLEDDINVYSIEASDIYGNKASSQERVIAIEAVSRPEYYLRLIFNSLSRYWYLALLALLLSIALTKPLWYKKYLENRLKNVNEAEKRIIALEKDTQMKYFKNHSITRVAYEKLMIDYKKRISDLREKRVNLQKRVNKN